MNKNKKIWMKWLLIGSGLIASAIVIPLVVVQPWNREQKSFNKIDDFYLIEQSNGGIVENSNVVTSENEIDWQGIDDIDNGVEIFVASDSEFAPNETSKQNYLELAWNNYLSITQTPLYTSASNRDTINNKVLNALNNILETKMEHLDTLSSELSSSTTLEKVNEVITEINQAIRELDGAKVIQEAKNNLKVDIKKSNLSVQKAKALFKLLKEINANQTDWEQRLEDIRILIENLNQN
ncbi:hypothetical protein ACW95P_01895 [Candidatus Mycoplasma pogonae]